MVRILVLFVLINSHFWSAFSSSGVTFITVGNAHNRFRLIMLYWICSVSNMKVENSTSISLLVPFQTPTASHLGVCQLYYYYYFVKYNIIYILVCNHNSHNLLLSSFLPWFSNARALHSILRVGLISSPITAQMFADIFLLSLLINNLAWNRFLIYPLSSLLRSLKYCSNISKIWGQSDFSFLNVICSFYLDI